MTVVFCQDMNRTRGGTGGRHHLLLIIGFETAAIVVLGAALLIQSQRYAAFTELLDNAPAACGWYPRDLGV